jgi:chromosomal replication initiator protein
VAMYIAHHEVDIPLQEIGERMDGRSHSTVLYSCDRVGDLMKTESQVRRDVQAILRALAPERSPAERPRQPEEHDRAG